MGGRWDNSSYRFKHMRTAMYLGCPSVQEPPDPEHSKRKPIQQSRHWLEAQDDAPLQLRLVDGNDKTLLETTKFRCQT